MKLGFILSILILTANAAPIHDNGTNIIWSAVFENSVPQRSSVTQAYCDSHTPTVIVTKIKQIMSESGVTAVNNVNIRYLSYVNKTENGLHFNIVSGRLSGKDRNGNPWKEPIRLYEQSLEEVGKTYTVWSTPSCKGIFIGYPSLVE